MVVTRMIRYDNKDNIVFEKRAQENGVSIKTRKDLEYDDKGNIVEVHEVVTMIDPSKPQPTIMSDSTTILEYKEYCGKSVLYRVTKDGLEIQRSDYMGRYTAANGDEVDESSTSIYVYSDYVDPKTNLKTAVNTIMLDTFYLTEENEKKLKEELCISKDVVFPDKFDVMDIRTEASSKDTTSEIVKVTMGKTDITAYTRRIDWSENENYGLMKEAFWVETGDPSDTVRYFDEYNRECKVDKDYNVIETTVEKELLSKIVIKGNTYFSREVVNEASGLPVYFYNIREEREYGTVDVNISEDYNHDIIYKSEMINGEIINQTYVRYFDDKKVYYTPKATEYEQVGAQHLVSMRLLTEESGAFTKEKYNYDSLGRLVLKSIHRKDIIEDKEEEYDGHIIYKYDNQGKCISEITENGITTYLYDKHGRKAFVINNVNYPLAKEIFDLHFNELFDILK